LVSPCGRIDGGFAAARQAQLAANAPKREFSSRSVGGHSCIEIRERGREAASLKYTRLCFYTSGNNTQKNPLFSVKNVHKNSLTLPVSCDIL
jgi:hypothetical protein